MAPHASVQSIRLYVANIGGSPPGREEQLINSVRSRFNCKWAATLSEKAQLEVFSYATEPIVTYLVSALGQARARGLGPTALGIHVHEVYRMAVARTRTLKRMIDITDGDEPWSKVEATLQLLVYGREATVPVSMDPRKEVSSDWTPAVSWEPRWYSARWAVTGFLSLAAIVIFMLRDLFTVGRSKFFVSSTAFTSLVSAATYWRYGFVHFPGCVRRIEKDDSATVVDDGNESQGSSVDGDSQGRESRTRDDAGPNPGGT